MVFGVDGDELYNPNVKIKNISIGGSFRLRIRLGTDYIIIILIIQIVYVEKYNKVKGYV